MIFATHHHQNLWEACTREKIVIEEVIGLIEAHPTVLQDAMFKQQLIARVEELEENSPIASMAFDYANFQYNDVKTLLIGRIPLRKEPDSRDTIYSYLPQNRSADREEYESQKKVHERFFLINRALKPGEHASQLYHEIRQAIVDGHTIILDGKSARSVNAALAKILSEAPNGAFPLQLKFRIGNTNLTCKRADERTRQKANFWLSVDELAGEHYPYGSYRGSVGEHLSALASEQTRERRLSDLMRAKAHTIQSFQELDFNSYAQIRLDGENDVDSIRSPSDKQRRKAEIASHIHYLNGLNFLRIVTEVSRRLYRQNGQVHNYQDPKARSSDAVPVGIFQARAGKLLSTGSIRQKDTFGESIAYGQTTWGGTRQKRYPTGGAGLHRAQYGVATGSGTIEHVDVMKQKADRVNAATEVAIIRPLVGNGVGLFRAAPVFETLNLNNQSFQHKAGKNHLRHELGHEFGGDYESDGENYSDDDDVEKLNDLFGNRFGI